jgi:calreticulin
VKHEQGIDCGGGYVKILPAGLDQSQFNGDSEYNVMFGPDICGATKRTHFIVTYKGKNHLIRNDIRTESDTYSHVYTLILRPDQTFTVKIDNNEVRTGSLTADFDILPPKEIPDPSVSKPADWVDVKEIADPTAQKPEGWDDIPAKIRDPEATQPEEWDSELDGEWEAPLIDNPDYKGEWVAPMIPNPDYKGPWIHPKIPNPDYTEDANIYAFDSNKYVGIEIWQVKAGSIFDNFLVTDDVALAEEWAARTNAAREAEKEQAKADAPAPPADGKTVDVEPDLESYDEEEELEEGHDEL